VARASGGGLAGHTQLAFAGDGVEVYQWDTLVRREHRGHGLGLALKIRAMQASADLLEGRTRVTTFNAASNQHMIAVNDRLGFRQTAWAGEYVRMI
jgi:RimJ/RimL family protein N-acetyltransferase